MSLTLFVSPSTPVFRYASRLCQNYWQPSALLSPKLRGKPLQGEPQLLYCWLNLHFLAARHKNSLESVDPIFGWILKIPAM